jgi:hypothetical protein
MASGAKCVVSGCHADVHTFVGIQEPISSFVAHIDDVTDDIVEKHAKATTSPEGVISILLTEDGAPCLRQHV